MEGKKKKVKQLIAWQKGRRGGPFCIASREGAGILLSEGELEKRE